MRKLKGIAGTETSAKPKTGVSKARGPKSKVTKRKMEDSIVPKAKRTKVGEEDTPSDDDEPQKLSAVKKEDGNRDDKPMLEIEQ